MAAPSVKDSGFIEMHFESSIPEAYIVKWKVKPGSKIGPGTVLLLYKEKEKGPVNNHKEINLKKWKALGVGTVVHLLKQEGDLVRNGCPIMSIKECSHPVVMKDMCAECGADLREDTWDQKSTASVAMVHSIPELRVSEEQAQILGKADEQRLFKDRKLVLLVDLDQTLIHTTNDEVDPNLKDVYHFQLYGSNSPWLHTKIRPGTHQFLKNISKMYELHICTFGSRLYAHTIVKFLDKEGCYFSYRILSRDECFSANSKTANLSALFPCGDNLVCIIDDREDVWNFAPNLVHVKPYHYFQHTGDINAPPGLTKVDLDENGTEVKNYKRSIKSDKNCKKLKVEETTSSAQVENLELSVTEHPVDDITMKDEAEEVISPAADTENQAEDVKSTTEHVDSHAEDVNSTTTAVESHDKDVEAPAEEVNCTTTDIKSKTEQLEESKQSLDENKMDVEKETLDNINDDDQDDYLLYLTDILTNIYEAFYRENDRSISDGTNKVPNLKTIVPFTRKQVLKGCHIVFSGVVPINMPLEKSRAFFVAKSLGAEIQMNIVISNGSRSATTHVVAARMGTVKVNEARRVKGIHVVTPDWLWCCSERWERVDEMLFPLTKDTPASLLFPLKDHLATASSGTPTSTGIQEKQGSESSNNPADLFPTYDPVTGKRVKKTCATSSVAGTSTSSSQHLATPGPSSSRNPRSKANFATTINPLMIFSSEDIARMGQEVDDEMDDSESDSEDSVKRERNESNTEEPLGISSSSSSGESLSADYPRKWNPKRNNNAIANDDEMDAQKKDQENFPRFPRGELPHDSDRSENEQGSDSAESIGSVDEEMVAAVEREFLGSG